MASRQGDDLSPAMIAGSHTRHVAKQWVTVFRVACPGFVLFDHRPPALLAAITAALPPAAPGSEHDVEVGRGKGRIVRPAIWVAPADGVDFPLRHRCFASVATRSTTQALR